MYFTYNQINTQTEQNDVNLTEDDAHLIFIRWQPCPGWPQAGDMCICRLSGPQIKRACLWPLQRRYSTTDAPNATVNIFYIYYIIYIITICSLRGLEGASLLKSNKIFCHLYVRRENYLCAEFEVMSSVWLLNFRDLLVTN